MTEAAMECECGHCHSVVDIPNRLTSKDFPDKLRGCREAYRRVLSHRLVLDAARTVVETGAVPVDTALQLRPYVYREDVVGSEDKPAVSLTEAEVQAFKEAVMGELLQKTNRIIRFDSTPTGAFLKSEEECVKEKLCRANERCDEMEDVSARVRTLQECLADLASTKRYAVIDTALRNLADSASQLNSDVLNQRESVLNEMNNQKSVSALRVLGARLRCLVREAEQEGSAIKERLEGYRKGWPDGSRLAKEYSELKAKIDRKKWAITELKKDRSM
ncbi:hypothetical protein AAG570_005403 [Ranatra chinensis]|uniref:Uncharacterized protein n=1 Tax=Ranatra chinensis TaxID=642074 RepID=A0ABD0Y0C2_9HEMI